MLLKQNTESKLKRQVCAKYLQSHAPKDVGDASIENASGMRRNVTEKIPVVITVTNPMNTLDV